MSKFGSKSRPFFALPFLCANVSLCLSVAPGDDYSLSLYARLAPRSAHLGLRAKVLGAHRLLRPLVRTTACPDYSCRYTSSQRFGSALICALVTSLRAEVPGAHCRSRQVPEYRRRLPTVRSSSREKAVTVTDSGYQHPSLTNPCAEAALCSSPALRLFRVVKCHLAFRCWSL